VRCVVLQPSYIPWRGYFDQIRRADVFVFYDDVQYDVRGWRNRNRIKTERGPRWLSIPVLSKGTRLDRTPIRDIAICWDRDWARRHLSSLRHSYGGAPHFAQFAPELTPLYENRPRMLAEFTIELSIRLAGILGVTDTRFLRSSEIDRPEARRTDDLLAILERVGATHYLTGPAARSYLDEESLSRRGIAVEYMAYDYPLYPQLYPPFDPHVSVLDLLFMTGPAAAEYIWGTDARR